MLLPGSERDNRAVTWARGATVVVREVWAGRTWSERPAVVAEDDAELIVLWVPKGTTCQTATDPSGVVREPTRAERFIRRMRSSSWVLGTFETDIDALWLLRPERWHAATLGFVDGTFAGWYMNLQEPYRRRANGIDTMDLALDLLVAPEGSHRWKDEDELDALVAAGIFPGHYKEFLRSEAESVLADLRAGHPRSIETGRHGGQIRRGWFRFCRLSATSEPMPDTAR